MARVTSKEAVESVRRFNRFYTRQIGLLDEGLLDSPFSLTEARVLYELAHRERPTATDLSRELGLDAGYLSRILTAFTRRGLVKRTASALDRRQSLLSLGRRGRQAFRLLDARSQVEAGKMIGRLSPEEETRLIGAMGAIESLLGGAASAATPYVLRPHRAGDMGWVVQRHGALYAQECGWDETFEALVAEIVARFIRRFDAKREQCWIAERDGERVGCVFVVRKTTSVAQLRLLLVEPSARGLGIGRRLVEECLRFARQAGYRRMTLWTNDVLTAARRLYRQAGFLLVEEEEHTLFGKALVSQTWDRAL